MKKFILCLGLGALIFTACKNTDKEKIQQDSVKIADLTQSYNEASNFNDSLLLLMGDIYAGLEDINQQEGLLTTPGIGDNVNERQKIKDNLAQIKERLTAQKNLLADLERKLAEKPKTVTVTKEVPDQKTLDENKVLLKTISDLRKHIESQEKRITELTNLLDQANVKIEELTTEVKQKDQQITVVTQQKDSAVNRAVKAEEATEVAKQETVAVENEANKVYYVLGSNKQLKDYGVLQKKFLSPTKVMQGDNINYSSFVTADKRTLSQIPTNAKKVEIKSNMPKDSYKIAGEKNDPKTIIITNPSEFWRNTPYLVVQLDDIIKNN